MNQDYRKFPDIIRENEIPVKKQIRFSKKLV